MTRLVRLVTPVIFLGWVVALVLPALQLGEGAPLTGWTLLINGWRATGAGVWAWFANPLFICAVASAAGSACPGGGCTCRARAGAGTFKSGDGRVGGEGRVFRSCTVFRPRFLSLAHVPFCPVFMGLGGREPKEKAMVIMLTPRRITRTVAKACQPVCHVSVHGWIAGAAR